MVNLAISDETAENSPPKQASLLSENEKPTSVKHKANTAEARESDNNSSDSEGESNSSNSDSKNIGLVARHALST